MSRTEPHSLPKGLIAWLPFLWSRVLFGGSEPQAARVRGWSLLLVLLLPAALLYPTRSFRLLEPDEGRYAQIAREMFDRGEWVVPTLQAEPYLDKPPLLYWSVILCYRMFGVSDGAARIIPALAVHLTILLLYLVGRRSVGERSAFWGALMLCVAPGFLGMGRLLILDGLLTLWVTLSLLAGFEAIRGEQLRRGWWLLAAAACGLGVLTKGPIAVILLVAPLIAHRWLTGQRVPIGWRDWLGFFGVVFAVNLPWYVAILLRAPVFLRHFLWEHNVLRFLQPFDHLQPVWYYVPILVGGFLPATLLLWSFGRFLLSGDELVARLRTPQLGFWLLAGGWCVLFFSLSGSKLPTYVLPAFPPLFLALGYFVAHSRWNESAWTKGGVAVMAGVLAFGFYMAVPRYAEARSPMVRPDVVQRYCADPAVTVICYPRNCDSVAFYLGRDDLRNVRSKLAQTLVEDILTRPRTVVLFTHRHSLEALRSVLPPRLRIAETVSLRHSEGNGVLDRLLGDGPWGLSEIAVVERVN
jgi:4-amino-4-deoxy-L-arabinose transferase-like glycosyltransferase